MDLRDVTLPKKFRSVELQGIASRCGRAGPTVHFAAVENDFEVAFVALDFFPPPQHLFLYWLYVCVDYRGQGIGSRVLQVIEDLARQQNYSVIYLRPHPLDQLWSKELLVEWYRKRGYECVGKDCDGMEKRLVGGRTPIAGI